MSFVSTLVSPFFFLPRLPSLPVPSATFLSSTSIPLSIALLLPPVTDDGEAGGRECQSPPTRLPQARHMSGKAQRFLPYPGLPLSCPSDSQNQSQDTFGARSPALTWARSTGGPRGTHWRVWEVLTDAHSVGEPSQARPQPDLVQKPRPVHEDTRAPTDSRCDTCPPSAVGSDATLGTPRTPQHDPASQARRGGGCSAPFSDTRLSPSASFPPCRPEPHVAGVTFKGPCPASTRLTLKSDMTRMFGAL